jgi:hypothetical protein
MQFSWTPRDDAERRAEVLRLARMMIHRHASADDIGPIAEVLAPHLEDDPERWARAFELMRKDAPSGVLFDRRFEAAWQQAGQERS